MKIYKNNCLENDFDLSKASNDNNTNIQIINAINSDYENQNKLLSNNFNSKEEDNDTISEISLVDYFLNFD